MIWGRGAQVVDRAAPVAIPPPPTANEPRSERVRGGQWAGMPAGDTCLSQRRTDGSTGARGSPEKDRRQYLFLYRSRTAIDNVSARQYFAPACCEKLQWPRAEAVMDVSFEVQDVKQQPTLRSTVHSETAD